MCLIKLLANSVGPDQTLHSTASDLGLHCLLRPLCPNTVFNLITAHAPISAQSSNSVVFILQPVYFYLLLYKT